MQIHKASAHSAKTAKIKITTAKSATSIRTHYRNNVKYIRVNILNGNLLDFDNNQKANLLDFDNNQKANLLDFDNNQKANNIKLHEFYAMCNGFFIEQLEIDNTICENMYDFFLQFCMSVNLSNDNIVPLENEPPNQLIKILAMKVKILIEKNKTKIPNVHNSNNKIYKKIQNYIFHLCKIKLDNDEIRQFIDEMNNFQTTKLFI